MAYDIRTGYTQEPMQIIFADNVGRTDSQAFKITYHAPGFLEIGDDNEFVFVNSKEDAKNLIKALEKAIDLGWLE